MVLYSRAGLIFLATLLVLVVTGSAITAGSDQYFGVLVKVDISNSYIVVMDPRSGSRFHFQVTDQTAVMEREEKKEMTDLEVGTPVIIEYDLSGEDYIAHRVLIQQTVE